jgi:hypothetical protein
MAAKPGDEYESIVANAYAQFADSARVTKNEYIVGKSGERRQCDVTVRTSLMGHGVLLIIECKDYNWKLSVGKVDELIGKRDDVGASLAILVSDVGFTSGAIRRANADGRIQLSSVFDVNNAKLKTQLRIPMIVEWRRPVPDPKVQYWSTRSPFTPDENVFTTVVNRFAQRWNSNSLDTELGEHIYIDGFELAPDHAIKIQATYKVTRRLFYKRVAITEGQGIIHVPSERVQKL